MTELETIEQSIYGPVTVESLARDFKALGVRPGSVLMVHSSMSKLGWVCGGAPAVILALETVLGLEGTLVMPAHSGDLSDPAQWINPPVPRSWWDTIRQTMPAYDPDLTPTRGMGAIAECFRKQAGTLRSAHPQTSFAARGLRAVEITSNHMLESALGEDSPLARLYELEGWVMLLGVGHGNNTSLHLAEHRANFPGKRFIRQGAPINVKGERQWVWFDDLEVNSDDFEDLGADFERETGQMFAGSAGYSMAKLYRQRTLVDYAVKWMEQHRK